MQPLRQECHKNVGKYNPAKITCTKGPEGLSYPMDPSYPVDPSHLVDFSYPVDPCIDHTVAPVGHEDL